MLVAIYVRISQENPDGYSLADQEQRCRQHAEAQGWTVARVYVDDGVSGRRWDRPALQRMLLASLCRSASASYWSMTSTAPCASSSTSFSSKTNLTPGV